MKYQQHFPPAGGLTSKWAIFSSHDIFRKVFIEDIYKRLLPERYETSVSEEDLD